MKNTKQIIIISIFVIILGIILFGNIQTKNKKLDILLKNQGFTSKKNSQYYKMQLSKNNINTYYNKVDKKQNTFFSTLSYDAESNLILKNKMDYQDEVTSVYNATYSYENNETTYSTRFTFSTANVIVKGTYQEKNNNFTCEVDFSYDVVTEKIKNSLCNKAHFETLEFISDKNHLFTKEINELIKDIIKQKNEE